jgi:hypothetical protein
MVDSNYNGFSGGSYYWNGNKVTKARFDYELTRQQERILAEVNKLATDQATSAVSIGAAFDQQEFGGLLRQVMPNLLDEFGQINSTAALDFYQQQANAYWEANKANPAGLSRDARRSRETNFARARTRSAIGLNTNQDKYVALLADNYDTAAKSERVIGWTMKVRAKDGHQAAVGAMNNAITREVASYHRDTVLFNAALDPYVSRVQRVAQATACEFCRLMALGSTNGRVRVSSYAVKFHDHCHCTIQPLFDGEDPIRPDYYDEFESEYTQAKSEWNGSNAGTKQTLANWREIQKTKANGTYVEESQARWQKIEDGLKQSKFYKPVTPEFLKFAGPAPTQTIRTINPDAPETWFWQEGGLTDSVERNTQIRLSRNLPLDQVRQEIPLLPKPDNLEEATIATNPKWTSEERGYKTNCVRAVHAYELRRRGYDVTASPKPAINDYSQNPFIFKQGWKDADGNDLDSSVLKVRRNAKRGTLTDNTAELIVGNYPEASRGWVNFDWQGGGAGHIVNWEIQNGKAVFIDPQNGVIDGEVLGYLPRAKDITVVRLDDKTPQAWVLQYLEGYTK